MFGEFGPRSNPEGYHEKTRRELRDQVGLASTDIGQSVIPESQKKDIFVLSLDEIKRRFPRRFDMYVRLLRQLHSGEEQISEKEFSHMRKWLSMLNVLDAYIAQHRENGEGATLRERQLTVFEDLRRFMEGERLGEETESVPERGQVTSSGADLRGYVKLPTGVGKTVLFVEFLEALKTRTLIVVPTKLLIHQTAERMEQFAPKVEHGKVYGDRKDFGKEATVITYDSLVQGLKRQTINPKDYDCLILDEAHLALSEERKKIVDAFPHAVTIGFTATPEYSRQKKVQNILPTEIHRMEIKEAVGEGLLAPLSVIIAKTKADLSKVSITEAGEYDQKELDKAINIEARNKAAAELYKKEFLDRKGIVYCNSIAHAEAVVKKFREQRITAEVISGKLSNAEQQALLTRYAKGEIQVLCNADILIQGFDEPTVSVCMNLRPTRSRVLAEQRGGRALRLDPSDPEKHAIIVDFLDQGIEETKNPPILFSDIIGASEILPSGSYARGQQNRTKQKMKKTGQIQIQGLEVITNTREVMRITQEIRELDLTFAPEGWMTKTALGLLIKIGPEKILAIANEYRDQHPDWFRDYQPATGTSTEHFSPQLIAVIRDRIETIPLAPEGWMTGNPLASSLGRGYPIISSIADEYRNEHPEWFREYRTVRSGPREHFSPQLIAVIRDRIETIPLAPEGWMTCSFLASSLKKGYDVIFSIADEYRDQHPEWFRKFQGSTGRPGEHYAPELIALIYKRIEETPPEGWMAMKNLIRLFRKDVRTISRSIDEYRDQHPEWFRKFRRFQGSTGPSGEHYAPELIDLIRKRFEEEAPPEGWMRKKPLAQLLGKYYTTISSIADEYRDQHPEWFREYRIKGGPQEYFSPQLVAVIRKRLGK